MRIGWTPPPPTYPEYAALREIADRAARGFVDPSTLGRSDQVRRRRGSDWCAAVLGHPFDGERYTPRPETELLMAADAAGIDPPLPQWLVDERAESADRQSRLDQQRAAARRRDEAAWAVARNACPVDVEVRPNLTAGVRNGQRQNLGHVVPLVDAVSGTRRRHSAGRAICETTSRRSMRLGEPTDAPATCIRCLVWAPKIRPSGLAASTTGSYVAGGAE